jgi:hypothetical protein
MSMGDVSRGIAAVTTLRPNGLDAIDRRQNLPVRTNAAGSAVATARIESAALQ